MPGVAGRLDHFTTDAKRKRLFVSALGNNTVEIVSLLAGKVVHSLAGSDGPQGVLQVPENDRIVVANPGEGKIIPGGFPRPQTGRIGVYEPTP